MTRRAIALTAAVVAVIALLPFEHAAADPPPTEGALAIAGYDADAFRSDDHMSLSVSENLFFNNTGSEGFAGNITLWVQPDAYISTRLCGSVRNQVAVVESPLTVRCMDLADGGAGVYRLRPFEAGASLSYYGETHSFFLNATARNASANGVMRLNATIGSSGVVPGLAMIGNLTLRAGDTHLSASASLTWGPPRNLTLSQAVELENTGTQDETVDLVVQGLPDGWTGRIQSDGQDIGAILLAGGSTATVLLNLSAPSHLVHVFLEYTIPATELPSGQFAATVLKVFPYNTTYVLLFLYALENDVVGVDGGFELHGTKAWDPSADRYRYAVIGFDLPAGSAPTVTVTWVPPPFEIPPWTIAALAVLGAGLVAYPVWQRRRKRRDASEEAEASEPEERVVRPMTREELRSRRDTLRKTLERLRLDREESGLPEDLHSDLEREARAELVEVDRRLETLTSAASRKKQIVVALRRLERDRKDGKVDKEVYASLKERYEREAVKAMKQIDEATGIPSTEETGHDGD